jgi:spore coat protein CotH
MQHDQRLTNLSRILSVLCLAAVASTVSPRNTPAQDKTARAELANSNIAKQKEFYQPDVVQAVRIQIADDDLQRMHAALPERIYVPAAFMWQDITIHKVAVRYKGNSSSSPRQRHKRSFLIKFDEYDNDQRFLGLRRVSFDNGVQFGSLFSEPIVTEILRDLGVTTHRANYAKLFLNEKYHGIYVNVERIDQTFIEQHLPDKNGALFKIDTGGPGANLQYLGENPVAYQKAFEQKSKSAKKDVPNLVEFIRMINQSPQTTFAKDLASKMDVESFLKVMPVMLFAGAFDQLTGWNPHNYYLYHDLDRDRWYYLPWDLDVGFSEVAFERIHVLEDWNAAWPIPGGPPNPLLEKIVADPELLKRYRVSALAILEKYFEPDRLTKIIDAKYELIKQDLENDPFPHVRATNPRDKDFASIVESQKDFVRKRYKTAKAQLQSPGKRPKIVRRQPPRGRNNEPQPGKPSKDAPSNLTAEVNAQNVVVLSWKDNAANEAGHIVQRATGAKSGKFRNYMGRPGNNVTGTTDRNVRPGQTYRYRVYAVIPTPAGPKGTGVSNVVTVKIKNKSNDN